MSDLDALTK
jgi:hypothetical protein